MCLCRQQPRCPNVSQGGVSTKSLGQGSAGNTYSSTWDVFPVELKNAPLSTAPAVTMTNFTNGTQPHTATFVVSSQAHRCICGA